MKDSEPHSELHDQSQYRFPCVELGPGLHDFVLSSDYFELIEQLETLVIAARPFGEMAQEILNGHPTGRLPQGAPEKLLAALQQEIFKWSGGFSMLDRKVFIVKPDDNELRPLELDVIEHMPYDRAAYQHEAGWLCEDMSGDQYWISEGGRVDKADEYEELAENEWIAKTWKMGWGTCPEIISRWQMLLAQEGS